MFCAGYQAALAACFPEFDGPGWSCLAASVREGATPCTLTRDGATIRLDGEKSWIAAVERIDRLVVAVEDHDVSCFVHVPRDATGLELRNPGRASFLEELGQGRAHFEGVEPAPEGVLTGRARGRRFRAAEALYVLAALAARLDDDGAVALATELSHCLDDRRRMKTGLATLGDRLSSATAELVEAAPGSMPASLVTSLRRDARLIALYVPRS